MCSTSENTARPDVAWDGERAPCESDLREKLPHLPSPCIVCHGISSRDPSDGPGQGLSAVAPLPGNTGGAHRAAISVCVREGGRGNSSQWHGFHHLGPFSSLVLFTKIGRSIAQADLELNRAAQASLEFVAICPTLTPKRWDSLHCHTMDVAM